MATYNGEKIYIKHLSHFDHLEFDEINELFVEKCKSDGLPSESERLSQLIKKGQWTQSKENEIAQLRDFISRLEDGRKGISVPSVLKNHNETIAAEKAKLNKLLSERSELVGLTVEIHSLNLLNDHYILSNLFLDKDLRDPLFTADSFDYLSESEVSSVIEAYSLAIDPCSDKNIKKLSVQPFFQQYFFICNGDISSFFGKPVSSLTHYQVTLANHASYFKDIVSNNDLSNLSHEKRLDPDAIEAYVNLKRNADRAIEEGRAPTGMTPEDIKSLGLEGRIAKAPAKEMNSSEFLQYLQKQKA